MPVIPLSRYRPQFGPPPAGVLSPLEDAPPAAFDPDALNRSYVQPSVAPPPIPPQRIPQPEEQPAPKPRMAPVMPPPGAPAPPSVELPPLENAEPPNPTPAPIKPAMASRTDLPAAPPKPPTEADQALTEAQERLKQVEASKPQAPKSNWAQRIATGVLALTRFAPVSDLLVHPKWSDQERQYERDLDSAKQGLQNAVTGLNAESLASQREANTALKNAQAEQAGLTADQRAAEKDVHHGMQEIDPAFVKENMPWLKPDAEGRFWVDKTIANTLTKPNPAGPKPMIVPAGSTVVDENGKVLYSAPATPLKEQNKPSAVQEYEYYVEQEKAAGRKPLSFDAYQSRDANRHVPVVNVNAQDHRDFQDETALRKEFEALPVVRAYGTVSQQAQRARSAYELAKKGGSANSADQAIVTVLNKVLDPQSVVRESEYARTAEGQSALNRLEGAASRISSGGAGLSTSEREAVMQTIFALEDAMKREYAGAAQHYRGLAQEYGFKPERIVPADKHAANATPEDPAVKAYADKFFGGDIAKAKAAIEQQKAGKK